MVLGFLTKINGVQHRAALFKFTGTDLYIWDSLDNSGGFLSLLDLEMNKSHSVGIPNELHRSYHRSGRRHLRIDHSGTHVLTGVRKEGRLDEVNTWKAVRRTPVPLEQWFPWEMNAGPCDVTGEFVPGGMRENLVREELENGPEETHPRADRRPFATDRSGHRQRKTHPTGVPRSRNQGTELLPLAQGVRRSEAGTGTTSERAGEGELAAATTSD